MAAGVNVMDLRVGINMAIAAVVSDLKSRAVMISTPEEITQVNLETYSLCQDFRMIYQTLIYLLLLHIFL